MTDLSILIPSRNELFLSKTIENILENVEGDSEVIAVLDGQWAAPPIADHPRVHLIYHSQPIGQRAATNEAARVSTAKYILKLDAHCSVDKGFDVKLMADCEYDWTVVPRMYNLHAFDWRCKACGHQTYQGPYPTKCQSCESEGDFEQVIIWQAKPNPTTDFMRFDKDLTFQYWGAYKKRPEAQGDIADTMSLLGACWFMHRQRYWDLDGLDEEHGSWGQMGTEIACKSWLSGGRLCVNKRTHFAHMFRTKQGPGWGFPYPNPGVGKARDYSRHLWLDGNWDKARHPLSFILEKFWPVPDWSEEDYEKIKTVGERFYMVVEDRDRSKDRCSPDSEDRGLRYLDMPGRETMEMGTGSPQELVEYKELGTESRPSHNLLHGIVYYTDCRLDPKIMTAAQRQLDHCRNGHQLVSVSLKPLTFGVNITLDLERSILTMFKQILAGLEACEAEVVFLAEHDWLYSSSHFDFVPPRRDVFYYNENTWKLDQSTGQALFYYCKQTAALCAYRELLIEHYRKRVERVEAEGWSQRIGFEPGTHSYPRGIDNYKAEAWMSEVANIDIRHRHNLTASRWSQDAFRDKRFCQGWTMADSIDGWGTTKGRFEEFLAEVLNQ